MGGPALYFWKYQGCGNHFVLLEERRAAAVGVTPARLDSGLARFLCAPEMGIGADGVLLLGKCDRGRASMRIWNRDGGRANMCGNGLRCAARWFFDHSGGKELLFETPAGLRRTRILSDSLVYAEMGVVRILDRLELDLPMALRPHFPRSRIQVNAVDAGNPHHVILCDRLDLPSLPLENLYDWLTSTLAPPDGTNLTVATPFPSDGLRARVRERGVGETAACGTGACALAAVAFAAGGESPVSVCLPGGELRVQAAGKNQLALIAPARSVFQGFLRPDF